MTFLELCKRVSRECGIAGTGPAAVTGQSGEASRVVNWVISAYDDLQIKRPDWYWLRGSFSFATTADDGRYTSSDAGIASRFQDWDLASLRLYLTSTSDEQELCFVPYDKFRSQYLVGPQTSSRPYHFSVSPAKELLLGPAPNDTYTVSGEYYKAPQTLAADSDEPELPSRYHMAIAYRAMMMYARFESASEIYEDANTNYKRLVRAIELNQLPGIEMGAPLL